MVVGSWRVSLRDIWRPRQSSEGFRFQGRSSSAAVARERLQVVVTHERSCRGGLACCMATLQKDILAVVRRHTGVHQDQVCITVDTQQNMSRLEVSVALPDGEAGE